MHISPWHMGCWLWERQGRSLVLLSCCSHLWLSGQLSPSPSVLPSCHEQPGLWAQHHSNRGKFAKGLHCFAGRRGGRGQYRVSIPWQHIPQGFSMARVSTGGSCLPTYRHEPKGLCPSQACWDRVEQELVIFLFVSWRDGLMALFTAVGRGKVSVLVVRGPQLGPVGSVPMSEQPGHGEGACWAHCAPVGCPRRCSFQPHPKKCHFPALSQVFLILNQVRSSDNFRSSLHLWLFFMSFLFSYSAPPAP